MGILRHKSKTKVLIAWITISGGLIVILGTWLSWFSLFAGLQPYRGVDVLNGRLLSAGGGLSILAEFGFSGTAVFDCDGESDCWDSLCSRLRVGRHSNC